jgi:DNA-binding phage protein
MTAKAGRSHDEVVVDMLRADPEFADAYLAAALEETEQPGGHQAMLTALRHTAEAQGMANVAKKGACLGSCFTVGLGLMTTPP